MKLIKKTLHSKLVQGHTSLVSASDVGRLVTTKELKIAANHLQSLSNGHSYKITISPVHWQAYHAKIGKEKEERTSVANEVLLADTKGDEWIIDSRAH